MNQTEYETETFGKINLIHADCMDVLRGLPDNSFDIALVDPPYGAGNQQVSEEIGGGYNRFGGRFNRYKGTCQGAEPLRALREVSNTPPLSGADLGGASTDTNSRPNLPPPKPTR
jgi:DNA modification methylase